jgi:membrane protease YdiL (CAAX protease family)
VLLWRFVFSPHARQNYTVALPAWETPPSEFLRFLLYVIIGSFALSAVAGFLAKPLGFQGDGAAVFVTAGLQLGMLIGALAYREPSSPDTAAKPRPNIFASGALTFLITLPLLIAAGKIWEIFLRLLGLPAEKQDVIEMFMRADSKRLLIAMILLATVIAPIAEELVFRRGLFRFFRTRMPRTLAFVLPGVIFASLHINPSTLTGLASFAPLVVLAVLLSAAYERTGHKGTPIVAHALFNLNMILLILAGIDA